MKLSLLAGSPDSTLELTTVAADDVYDFVYVVFIFFFKPEKHF